MMQEGGVMILHDVVIKTVDLASLESQDGVHRLPPD